MHVSEIWRYPVKSLKGERLKETEIASLGIPGDRQIAVIRTINGRFLTSRSKPKLLGSARQSINAERLTHDQRTSLELRRSVATCA